MLIPAILKKEEILENFAKCFYTEDMFYVNGALSNWIPDVENEEDGFFQYAVVDKNGRLLGYLAYWIDWYCDAAYNFSMISFDKGNLKFGRDVYNKIEELIKRFHRVEWRMVGGNPVEQKYDSLIEKHGGRKHVLRDCLKDREGNYRDSIIYEIVNN